MESGSTITADHLQAKARIFSEGVRIKGKEEPPFSLGLPNSRRAARARNNLCPTPPVTPPTGDVSEEQLQQIWTATSAVMAADERESKPSSGMRMTFHGSGLTTFLHGNKYSRLEVSMEGDAIVVKDGDQVLVTGYEPPAFGWRSETLSNELPIGTFLPAMSREIINLVFYLSCSNYNTGRGCKYCNLFSNPLSQMVDEFPVALQQSWAKNQAEAVRVAIDHGWNGHLAVSGGALPDSLRPHYMNYLRICLDAVREAVGEEKFRELDVVYNHYPPERFEDMHEWKALGVKRTTIDIEVVGSDYFSILCPGKAAFKSLEFWKEAQVASVDVFGRFFNTTGNVILGLEPMDGLLEGVEERLSKGVMLRPVIFCSAPNSEFWGFRPPTADWILEATERMADLYLKYISFDEVEDDFGSQPTILVFDMIKYKLQRAN
jgi:hypothetical protein